MFANPLFAGGDPWVTRVDGTYYYSASNCGVADLCIVDPALEWQVEPGALRSQGKHTPFAGYPLQGRARHTLVAGRVVHE